MEPRNPRRARGAGGSIGALAACALAAVSSAGSATAQGRSTRADSSRSGARDEHSRAILSHVVRGDPSAAAELIERRTAPRAGQGGDAEGSLELFTEAVELRLAAGEHERAASDALGALRGSGSDAQEQPRAWGLVERVGGACEQGAARAGARGDVSDPAGAVIERDATLARCARLYREALGVVRADAPLEVRVRSRVALGRVLGAMGDEAGARVEYRAALAMYHAAVPGEAARDVMLDGVDPYPAQEAARRREEARARREQQREEREARRRGRRVFAVVGGLHEVESGVAIAPVTGGLTRIDAEIAPGEGDARVSAAIAEARYALARYSLRFVRDPMPPYSGPADRAGYDRWIEQLATPWMRRRLFYLREVLTPQMMAVMSLHVAPWDAAAMGELAAAYQDLGEALREAPVAPDLAADPELRQAYDSQRDSIAEQFFRVAEDGLTACARRAAQARAGTTLAFCEERLHRLNPFEHPLSDEVIGGR